MQLSQNLTDALQAQLNVERLNSAIYRAMSLALENANWPGTAAHFAHASQDEQGHADKIAGYLIDRNTQPLYAALPLPTVTTPDLLPCFQAAMEREQLTSAAIDQLAAQAESEGDRATCIFLQWFVMEQIESEREYTDKLLEVSRAQGDTAALLFLDREYGK